MWQTGFEGHSQDLLRKIQSFHFVGHLRKACQELDGWDRQWPRASSRRAGEEHPFVVGPLLCTEREQGRKGCGNALPLWPARPRDTGARYLAGMLTSRRQQEGDDFIMACGIDCHIHPGR